MKLKNYIAVFFIFIFLGKMISIEAQFMEMVFDNSEVTLVNKLCPKKQLQTHSDQEYATDNFTPSLELDHLCQVAFDIPIHQLSEVHSENNFERYSYRIPGDFSIPADKFYPPPKG